WNDRDCSQAVYFRTVTHSNDLVAYVNIPKTWPSIIDSLSAMNRLMVIEMFGKRSFFRKSLSLPLIYQTSGRDSRRGLQFFAPLPRALGNRRMNTVATLIILRRRNARHTGKYPRQYLKDNSTKNCQGRSSRFLKMASRNANLHF